MLSIFGHISPSTRASKDIVEEVEEHSSLSRRFLESYAFSQTLLTGTKLDLAFEDNLLQSTVPTLTFALQHQLHALC